MKERLYRGFWDDGHDYGEFDYYSTHRNNSKENLEDAYREYQKRHGRSHKIKITRTYLVKEIF